MVIIAVFQCSLLQAQLSDNFTRIPARSAWNRSPLQTPPVTVAPGTFSLEHPGWNNFFRKSFLMTVGAFNSEVLFSNIGATRMDGVFITLIYGAPFVVMDEIVQKYDLDNWSIFYLGSIFGLVLEDGYVNTVQEAPLFFTTFITTFWHGGITVWSSFALADQFFPRSPGKPLNKPVFRTALGTIGIMGGLMFAGYTLPTFTENLPVHVSVLALMGGFTWLIKRNINKDKAYRNRPLLALGMIGLGYELGNRIHALDASKPVDQQENILTRQDLKMRNVFYGSLAVASLTKYIVDRSVNTKHRFSIIPLSTGPGAD
ncbi:MAG: hypothetical protein GXO90_04165, partial [FCB group bacterium]|nr:hypothetical protein [FCB group bacterium]